jgi:hypothetical protein
MTDPELEQHITDLGLLIKKAYAEGDRAAARAWAAARAEAIAARSPEQIEAMETERGLGPCQFTVMAEADRAAAGAGR